MIRKAQEGDLRAVDGIYNAILDQEEASGVSYTNWQRGKYPTVAYARRALEAGTLYVAEEDGTVYGAAVLNAEQLPEYDAIPWQFQAQPQEVMVIHTLVIHPAWSGGGRARAFVAFCQEEARRQGKKVIRLDTYQGNQPANALYQRLGYHLAGATEFFFMGFIHEVLNCYETLLSP